LEQPKAKNYDYVWWSFSAATGALIWSVPSMIQSGGKGSDSILLMAVAAMILSGIAFGYFEPRRYWRWALASILPLPLIEITAFIINPSNAAGNSGMLHSLPYLIVKIPIYILQGLPLLLGAAAGAAIQHSDRIGFGIKISRDQKIWLLGAVIGSLCCLLYFLISESYQSAFPFSLLKAFVVLLIVVSACFGFIYPQSVSRWAFAIGTGVVALVDLRIIISIFMDPGSNNLFPIAIFFAIVLSYPFTFVGAYIGLYLKTGESLLIKILMIIVFTLVATEQLLGPPLKKSYHEADLRQKTNEFTFKVRHNSRGASVNGNKLWLQFEANKFKIKDKKAWDNNQSVYVTFEKDSLGFAWIQEVTKNQPVNSKYWVKTMAIRNSGDSSFLRINYPFSNFPIEEKYAKGVETGFISKMKDSLSLITLKVFIKENQFQIGDLSIDSLIYSDFVRKLDKK